MAQTEITSRMELTQAVIAYYIENCSLPYPDIIEDTVRAHMLKLCVCLGKLELCHLRTKQEEKDNGTD